MALRPEEIKRLAELARLDLPEEETERMRQEVDRRLEYVSRLSKIDTSGVPETEAGGEDAILREDVALPMDEAARQLILMNFPARQADLLQVPAVFETPKG